jgi:hypothetical protein
MRHFEDAISPRHHNRRVRACQPPEQHQTGLRAWPYVYRARHVLCKYSEDRNIYLERVTGLMYIVLSCTGSVCSIFLLH